MNIRNAVAGDEKHIAKVIIDTWKTAYEGIVPNDFLSALTTDKHEALFKENILKARENVFVLENEKREIVGMTFGGQDRTGEYDAELVAIYILPYYQKMGYGKRMVQALVEVFKQKGYKSMLIWTFTENKDRKFYEKLGGIPAKETSYRFGEKDIALTGYVWQDINTLFM